MNFGREKKFNHAFNLRTHPDRVGGRVARGGPRLGRVAIPAPKITEASDEIAYLAPMPRVARGLAAPGVRHHHHHDAGFSVRLSVLNEFSASRSCTSRPALPAAHRGTRIPTIASARRHSAGPCAQVQSGRELPITRRARAAGNFRAADLGIIFGFGYYKIVNQYDFLNIR